MAAPRRSRGLAGLVLVLAAVALLCAAGAMAAGASAEDGASSALVPHRLLQKVHAKLAQVFKLKKPEPADKQKAQLALPAKIQELVKKVQEAKKEEVRLHDLKLQVDKQVKLEKQEEAKVAKQVQEEKRVLAQAQAVAEVAGGEAPGAASDEAGKLDAQHAAAAAKETPEQEARKVEEEERVKQATIKALKANTPPVPVAPAVEKVCRPRGVTSSICSVVGGGDVSPFGGKDAVRLPAEPHTLLAKFRTTDPKFAWWVASSNLVRLAPQKEEARIASVAVRCGKDLVVVTMPEKQGSLPEATINGAAHPFDGDKPLSLPHAPATGGYGVRRTQITEGEGQASSVEVEVLCGSAAPAATPYAAGLRVVARWAGWEAKDPKTALRSAVRVVADMRYEKLLRGACGWGEPEPYPRWLAEPLAEATPEFAGGEAANVECQDKFASDSLETTTVVPEVGRPVGDVASARAMEECQAKVESCVGYPMDTVKRITERLDVDVAKTMVNEIKACAADRTKGDRVDRAAVCGEVCGMVREAVLAADREMEEVVRLANDCTKVKEAEVALKKLAGERHNLKAMCGGDAKAPLVVPALPPCGTQQPEPVPVPPAPAPAHRAAAHPEPARAPVEAVSETGGRLSCKAPPGSKVVPAEFENNPVRPLQPQDWKETCSKTA